MLAFGIRYLTGFAAAAEPDDRERAEWPPHPGRVFMALAAAHFQTGTDLAEHAALQWLEGSERGGEISAPAIVASEAWQRAIVKQYVPVNDKAGPSKASLHSLPLTRERNERVFARTWPDDDRVYLQWIDLDPPEPHRRALAALCAKVTRIGHSSSLVQMWLAEPHEISVPNWVPDDARAVVHLRIPGPGTLDHLVRQYNAAAVGAYTDLKVAEMHSERKTKASAKKQLRERFGKELPPQSRPRLAFYQGYARSEDAATTPRAATTIFSPHLLICRLEPAQAPFRQLDLIATLNFSGRWREAILSHSNGLPAQVRGVLSGHNADGSPADEAHLAFLPLAFVGHEHADGHLLGMGLALPAQLAREDRREALRVIAAVRELKLGPLGVWRIESVATLQPPHALRAEAWTAAPGGATDWSTVTPVALDRHPKTKDKAQYQQRVAASIAEACTRIGLPKPREVIVTQVSAHLGVPPSFAFPRLKRKDGSERRHTHAIIVFNEPVYGPVLVGAGRFRGYGLCKPLDSQDR